MSKTCLDVILAYIDWRNFGKWQTRNANQSASYIFSHQFYFDVHRSSKHFHLLCFKHYGETLWRDYRRSWPLFTGNYNVRKRDLKLDKSKRLWIESMALTCRAFHTPLKPLSIYTLPLHLLFTMLIISNPLKLQYLANDESNMSYS